MIEPHPNALFWLLKYPPWKKMMRKFQSNEFRIKCERRDQDLHILRLPY